jgi:predicted amidohydrolase
MTALVACGAIWGQDWQLWSPRDEIAPRGTREASGELVLEGAGNAAVFGGWQRVYPGIRAGQWYKLQLRYRATGLDFEPLQVPVRLDWQKPGGEQAGRPDYAWRVSGEGEWRTLTHEAPAPQGAVAVQVQIWLQNAPRGVVRYKDISVTPTPAPAARPVRIATVRFHPNGADPVTKFVDLVDAKVAQGTDVILLPEGVTVVGTHKKYADVAESVPGPTTQKLGELARRKQSWIVAGVYEREGKVIYNTAVLIGRDGKFAGKYRKVYIPREELEGGITPGSGYPTFKTDFGTVGMMICWDTQYADPARGLALRGAELVLVPIWGGNETLTRARAIENRLFIASSGYDFPSLVFDPDGETLARSETDGTVALATIDLNRRYTDPWLGDMRARYFRELRGDLPAEPAGRR